MNTHKEIRLQHEIQKLETIFTERNTNFKRTFHANYVHKTITDYQTFLTTKNHRLFTQKLKPRAQRIRTFKSVFGDVKRTLEIIDTVISILETYELKNPKKLEHMCRTVIKKHPKLEVALYKTNTTLSLEFNYDHDDYAKTILNCIHKMALKGLRKKFDVNLHTKAQKAIESVIHKEHVDEKSKVVKDFLKHLNTLKTTSPTKECMTFLLKLLDKKLDKFLQ